MKKTFLCILCIALLLSLIGCQKQPDFEQPVTFYYQTLNNSYEAESAAIQSETREGKDLVDLQQVFTNYLQGPASESLFSPFPAGLRLVSYEWRLNTLYLTFSDQLGDLTGLELTIACCCIALTCLDMTGASKVCISAENALLGGEKTVSFTPEEILLLDLVQQPKND